MHLGHSSLSNPPENVIVKWTVETLSAVSRDESEMNLFTRPRRCGKSLNMCMLRSFFEIDGDEGVFDDLAVSRDTELCEKYVSQHPVLFLTLKGVDGLRFEMVYQSICVLIIKHLHH